MLRSVRHCKPKVTLFGLLVITACGPDPSQMSHALKESLQTYDGSYGQALKTLYTERDYQPIWSKAKRLRQPAASLLTELCQAEQQGLDAADYDLDHIERLLREAYVEPPQEDWNHALRLAELELDLSAVFLRYADHLGHGRIAKDKLRRAWAIEDDAAPVDLVLTANAATAGEVARAVRSVVDHHAGYAELQKALVRYQEIEGKGGWPTIPAGPVLSRGRSGERVSLLRQRLMTTGDLDSPATDQLFDEALAAAVTRFQARHGLEGDGVVGGETLAALNVPVADRIRQITVNLERHRWLPQSLGDEYVMVNIPDFRLHAQRDGKPALSMAVIVGQRMQQTPIFSGEMTYLVFRPYWNVPESIAVEELLPKFKEEGYLERDQFEGVDGDGQVIDISQLDQQELAAGKQRLRQRPGYASALGLVKFMFPNEFNVYLHDTPTGHLFERSRRDFSHGCIRVERPLELAEYALEANDDWSRQRIEEAMVHGEDDREVKLERPIPVRIIYLTAWVDSAGVVQFRRDIYGHDASVQKALDKHRSGEGEIQCRSIQQLLDQLGVKS